VGVDASDVAGKTHAAVRVMKTAVDADCVRCLRRFCTFVIAQFFFWSSDLLLEKYFDGQGELAVEVTVMFLVIWLRS
jgi:hypothetical protein